jgi:Cdc6-like AAA superfamily ATPase
MPTADIRRHMITGIEPPTSGIALKKLYEKVAETLTDKNKTMFVILDDEDFLNLSEYPASRGDWIQPP